MRFRFVRCATNAQAESEAPEYRRSGRGHAAILLALALMSWSSSQSAHAQAPHKSPQRPVWPQQPALQKKLNDGTVMMLSGRPGTGYFTMARDIAAALGESEDLRLLPVDTAGGSANLRDLLLLRGMDLALVPANVLAQANTAASFGPAMTQRVNYVARLYAEELHIIVGAGITSLDQLRGKKIAVPPQDGNADFTLRDLLERLHIEAEVVNIAAADAIDDVRSGVLGALVLMGGKPLRMVAGLPKDGSLRLLALPIAQALGESYAPSTFHSEDYPALIPDGQSVDTVAVSAVLVTNQGARTDESYRRVAKFVPSFFAALSELSGPQWHPKWTEVNLAANLPGWTRFPVAQQWLSKAKQDQAAAVQRSFEEFLSTTGGPGASALPPKMRQQLFEEFVKWTRRSSSAPPRPAGP